MQISLKEKEAGISRKKDRSGIHQVLITPYAKTLLEILMAKDGFYAKNGGVWNELLPAHKAIMEKASDVFERMFPYDEANAKAAATVAAAAGTDPSEEIKPVEVTDVEVGTFKAMLAFIYADDLSGLNGDNAISLLYAVPSGVLEEDEQVGVYQYHSHPNAGLPELSQLQFPTNGRVLTVWRSVFAEWPIPKWNSGTFYYEVTILEKRRGIDGIYIGLATEQIPLGTPVGWSKGTYSYASHGNVWGHEVEGCSHWKGRPYIGGKFKFVERHVIGCGVNLATGQIIYTINGHRLGENEKD
ncbi:Ran-binding protein 9 [Globodera pallida]|nr:Ran-binding protein 9 [Globodera pallida]